MRLEELMDDIETLVHSSWDELTDEEKWEQYEELLKASQALASANQELRKHNTGLRGSPSDRVFSVAKAKALDQAVRWHDRIKWENEDERETITEETVIETARKFEAYIKEQN